MTDIIIDPHPWPKAAEVIAERGWTHHTLQDTAGRLCLLARHLMAIDKGDPVVNVRPEFMVELARLLRDLAGPDCSCRVCLDARIAADQIDRAVAREGDPRG